MFEDNTPKQRAHLTFGAKKRGIMAFASLANSTNLTFPGTFLASELQQLKDIQNAALSRAEKERDLELRKADSTPTRSGSEEEHRTYNGK